MYRGTQVVDPDGGERGDIHVAARHHRREHGAAVDPARSERELHGPAVGDRRLHARPRGGRPDGWLAGRPPGAPRGVRRGPRHLRGVLAGRRAGLGPDRAEPLPGRAGHRRRGDVRRLAGAAGAGVRTRPRARPRARRLRGDDRHRGGRRPAGRRRDHERPRLALGVLPERADRPRGDRA